MNPEHLLNHIKTIIGLVSKAELKFNEGWEIQPSDDDDGEPMFANPSQGVTLIPVHKPVHTLTGVIGTSLHWQIWETVHYPATRWEPEDYAEELRSEHVAIEDAVLNLVTLLNARVVGCWAEAQPENPPLEEVG